MQSLPYLSLTESQRAQVAHLFADDVFGTDAGAFVYEVDGDTVKGRKAVNGKQSPVTRRASKISPVNVTMLQEVNITDELITHAHMSMDALAASIAERLIQHSQLEEVNAS